MFGKTSVWWLEWAMKSGWLCDAEHNSFEESIYNKTINVMSGLSSTLMRILFIANSDIYWFFASNCLFIHLSPRQESFKIQTGLKSLEWADQALDHIYWQTWPRRRSRGIPVTEKFVKPFVNPLLKNLPVLEE